MKAAHAEGGCGERKGDGALEGMGGGGVGRNPMGAGVGLDTSADERRQWSGGNRTATEWQLNGNRAAAVDMFGGSDPSGKDANCQAERYSAAEAMSRRRQGGHGSERVAPRRPHGASGTPSGTGVPTVEPPQNSARHHQLWSSTASCGRGRAETHAPAS